MPQLMHRRHGTSPELWGGVECSFVRVGDGVNDQLALTGHDTRVDDLERFQELRVVAMRYPVLWERTAPQGLHAVDWRWADERLSRLRDLGIRPIVGLVHHGSGPGYASYAGDGFAEGLAEFASAVARRYPWIDAYTPVNEPLTTARFSGLYGHWYPHRRDDREFLRILFEQCRGIALAMTAIRRVNPDAQLIQTEDYGRTHSTSHLRYQADFENERRWLSLDLLLGRVDQRHPMWGWIRGIGVSERELGTFLESPTPPDVIGFNYYVTSERYLDERLDEYPESARGGNGRERYADVEVVRVADVTISGLSGAIDEVWGRYGLPTAITESQIACTREEQLRWFMEAWHAAQEARSRGVDLRAVTAWALLGAYDWNSLLTRPSGYYEPGAFDILGGVPRPTALATMLRELGHRGDFDHPVLDSPGWWKRRQRIRYGSAEATDERRASSVSAGGDPGHIQTRPVAIVGEGPITAAFATACQWRGLSHAVVPVTLAGSSPTDEVDAEAVLERVRAVHPWGVVYVGAEGAAIGGSEPRAPVAAELLPSLIAARCAASDKPFLLCSSHAVFSWWEGRAYTESDAPRPDSERGESRLRAERAVAGSFPRALLIRSGALMAAGGGPALTDLDVPSREADGDSLVSAVYVPDLVDAALDLLIDAETGIWHLVNAGSLRLRDLPRAVRSGLMPPSSPREAATGPGRPRTRVLRSERAELLPPLEDALRRLVVDGRGVVVSAP